MKTKILIAALFLNVACSKSEPPRVATTNAYKQERFLLEKLDGLRVKELLIVVFDHDYEIPQWKRIFDQTKELSANKRRLREIEGVTDTAADQVRGDLIARNADLLTELGDQSLFIMSWSANDENCRFKGLQLGCRPKSLDNPLNGGLPIPTGDIEWVEPDPVTADTKSSYLKILLTHREEPGYQLELRLKLESDGGRELWFKGEALPLPGSVFKNAEGSLKTSKFPYGYAEMTLGQ